MYEENFKNLANDIILDAVKEYKRCVKEYFKNKRQLVQLEKEQEVDEKNTISYMKRDTKIEKVKMKMYNSMVKIEQNIFFFQNSFILDFTKLDGDTVISALNKNLSDELGGVDIEREFKSYQENKKADRLQNERD